MYSVEKMSNLGRGYLGLNFWVFLLFFSILGENSLLSYTILIKPEKCKDYFGPREDVIGIMCPPATGNEACCFFSDFCI